MLLPVRHRAGLRGRNLINMAQAAQKTVLVPIGTGSEEMEAVGAYGRVPSLDLCLRRQACRSQPLAEAVKRMQSASSVCFVQLL